MTSTGDWFYPSATDSSPPQLLFPVFPASFSLLTSRVAATHRRLIRNGDFSDWIIALAGFHLAPATSQMTLKWIARQTMPSMGSNRFAFDCLAFSSGSVNTWTARQLAQSAALVDRRQRRNANSFYLRSQCNGSVWPSSRYVFKLNPRFRMSRFKWINC